MVDSHTRTRTLRTRPRPRALVPWTYVATTVLALIACAPAWATTRHVTKTADSGPGSLRKTIATASPGDVIVVPAGNYKLTAAEIVIKKKLEIDGAGAAATTISGNDAHRVFSLVGAAGVKITRLAIIHGRLAQVGGSVDGAGVLIDAASSLTLDSVRVTDNVADASGDATHSGGTAIGGALSNSGTLALVRSAVDHNTARSDGVGADKSGGVIDGGAIYNQGTLSVGRTSISGNTVSAVGQGTGAGGVINAAAIYSTAGSLPITTAAINGNVAHVDGGSSGSGGVVNSGGVYNTGTSLTLTRTSISGNTTTALGHGSGAGGVINSAAIYNPGGDLTVTDAAINHNAAHVDGGGDGGVVNGGGVYNPGGIFTLTRSSASGNATSAVGHGSGAGGVINSAAIYNPGGDLTATDVAINHNTAHVDGGTTGPGGVVNGGGVYNPGSSFTLTRAGVNNNSATATGGTGAPGGVINSAGVYLYTPSPHSASLSNSRLGGNSTDVDGGADGNGGVVNGVGLYASSDGQLTVNSTTIDGNRGTARGQGTQNGGVAYGGGAEVYEPTTMTNVTVTGNSLDGTGGGSSNGGIVYGGGIYAGNAITLLNSTIADNSLRAPGGTPGTAQGGNLTHGAEATHVKNTIVSGGHADAGYENCREPFGSDGHNLDSRDQCGFHTTGDQIGKNPLLAALKNNGGPVPTRGLLAHSPAFNKGDNSGCPTSDARGAPRPAFVICDIGAFEAQPPPVISGLTIKPNTFQAQNNGPTITVKSKQKPRGTTVSYKNSLAALATFRVLRRARGIRKGALCVRPPKKITGHPKRCTRYVPVGKFFHQDTAGPNHFHFTGRLHHHKLGPGRYRLTAVASLWAVTGSPKAAPFTIIP